MDLKLMEYNHGASIMVLPLISNPVDADSDNDGIIDIDDDNPLNNYMLSPEGKEVTKCSVLTTFRRPITSTVIKNTTAFSFPVEGMEMTNIAFTEAETVKAVAIVLSDSSYWIKIRLKTGLNLYIKYENIKDYESLGVVFGLQNRQVLNVKDSYIYKQTGDDYGYSFPKYSCATFSYATALSLIFQCKFTPDLIDADYRGYVSSFDFNVCKKEVEEDGRKIINYEKITKDNNQDEPVFKAARLQRFYSSSGYAYANMCSDKEKVMFEIDQILNNSYVPIMFHVYNNDNENEHWSLIIGKIDGKYWIYDPYFGEIGVLEDTMQYYRKDYNGNWSYEYGVIIKSYE